MSADLLSRVRREIDGRLRELRPAVREYERLLAAAESNGLAPASALQAAGSGRSTPKARPRAARASSARVARRAPAGAEKRKRAPRGTSQLAIVAALEHGSHTVSELVVVTALAPASVREGVRRLTRTGIVAKAERDGKPAYALSAPAS
jgi:DNA-binding transcriptional ArsR family regulator